MVLRIPLRFLIPSGIFFAALGLLIAFAASEVRISNLRAEENLQKHARVIGNIVASAVETAERRGDPAEASFAFEQTRADRRLVEAVIVDESDRISYASTLTLRGAPLHASKLAVAEPLLAVARISTIGQIEIADDGKSVLSVFPIRLAPTDEEFTGGRIGALLMRHSIEGEKTAAVNAAINRVGVLGLVLALVCLAVWWFSNRILVKPLLRLVDAADRLAQDRPVHTLSGQRGAAEIERLAGAFDQMADALRRRTDALEESRAFLFATMDALPSHVAVLDAEGRIIAVNDAWRKFGDRNGLTLSNHGVGASYLKFCDDAGDGIGLVVADGLRRILSGERTEFHVDYSCPTPERQQWFALEMRLFESGGIVRVLTAHQNITSLKYAESALRRGEERYRILYENNPLMFLTVKAGGVIASINKFGAEQLGYRAADLVGTSLYSLYEEEVRDGVREHLNLCLASPGVVDRWETSKLRKDGTTMWVRETARSIRTPKNEIAVLVVCEDVTETQELSKRLKYQASYDALTGLINRHEFERRLGSAVQSAASDGAEHVLCYLDLDQFKVVNDTCGHMAGDELLRQVAQTVKGNVRNRDTLARLGGDEFGILMEHCSLDRAMQRAEAVRAAVEDCRFAWEGNVFALGASIGVAAINVHSASVSSVMSAADAACYAAKDEGRNRVNAFRADDLDQNRRHGEMRWVARLQRALDDGLFELFFQRIVALSATDTTDGLHYEVLIRLRDEDGQLIAPGAFLPAAERFHLASRIDRWVLSASIDWLSSNPEHVRHLALCTINVSGQSLAEDAFLDFVIERIASAGVPAGKLGFEITETAAIANLSKATRFIRKLSELGCRFALDDFGSGLSSFGYLKHLPVDILKIDGIFVRDIATNPIDAAMVRSINEIGHLLRKQTVAEFVNSDAVIERLRDIGVDYIQGYAVHRPRPLSDLQQLTEERYRIGNVSGS